jgi:antitoxin YefM
LKGWDESRKYLNGEMIMDAVTTYQASQNLDLLIDRVIANAEPTILCNDKGSRAVPMALDEFNSWQETLYLLSNPANAEHLRKSIREAAESRVTERELTET